MKQYLLLIALTLLTLGIFADEENAEKVSLGFHVVRDQEIKDGMFIDTEDYPKLGYISQIPEIEIVRITGVELSDYVSETWYEKQDGTSELWGQTKIHCLDVTFLTDPPDQMKAETTKHQGKYFVLMMGEKPIYVARLQFPIEESAMRITGEEDQMKMLQKLLRSWGENPLEKNRDNNAANCTSYVGPVALNVDLEE